MWIIAKHASTSLKVMTFEHLILISDYNKSFLRTSAICELTSPLYVHSRCYEIGILNAECILHPQFSSLAATANKITASMFTLRNLWVFFCTATVTNFFLFHLERQERKYAELTVTVTLAEHSKFLPILLEILRCLFHWVHFFDRCWAIQ